MMLWNKAYPMYGGGYMTGSHIVDILIHLNQRLSDWYDYEISQSLSEEVSHSQACLLNWSDCDWYSGTSV